MAADQQDGSARPGDATLIYNKTAAKATRDLLEKEVIFALVRMIPSDPAHASNGEAYERKQLMDLVNLVGGLSRCDQLLASEGKQSAAFPYLKAAHDIAADAARPFTRGELAVALGSASWPVLNKGYGDTRTRLESELINAYGDLPAMDEPAWIHSVLESFGRLDVANAVARGGSKLAKHPAGEQAGVAAHSPVLAAQRVLGEAFENAPKEDVPKVRSDRPLAGPTTKRVFGWGSVGLAGAGLNAVLSLPTPVTAIIAGVALLLASGHVGGEIRGERTRRNNARANDRATRSSRRDNQNRLRAARSDLTDVVTAKTGLPQLPQLKPPSGTRDSGQRTR